MATLVDNPRLIQLIESDCIFIFGFKNFGSNNLEKITQLKIIGHSQFICVPCI